MGAAFIKSNFLGRVLAENASIPKKDTVDMGDAEPMFPADNVRSGRPGKVCRFKRSGFPFQLAADTIPPTNAMAILNHNLKSTATVRLYSADAIAGPYNMTVLPVQQGKPFWFGFTTTTGRKWWRLVVEWVNNATTVDNKPLEIGEWWVGFRENLPPFAWGVEDRTEVVDAYSESEYGVPTAHFLSKKRVVKAAFADALDDATAAGFMSFRDYVQGRVKPFLFIPDTTNANDVMLARFTAGSWDTKKIFPGFVGSIPFEIQEDPWGKTGV